MNVRRLALGALLGALAAGTGTAQAQHCGRACLVEIGDAYLAALVASDPSAAPLAPNIRFTEQTEALAVGEGLWKTASEAPTTFKVFVPDPVSGQLGGIVMMRESGDLIQLGLRLRIENREITEAEHLVVRNLSPNQLVNLRTPRPGLVTPVAPVERLPREVMLLFGHAYYDAIEQSDGDAVPFADACMRRENGFTTAGPPGSAPGGGPPGAGAGFTLQGCREQLHTRVMSYIDSIDLRRVRIADEEMGLVFGMSMFRHPMETDRITIITPDGTLGERPMAFQPFDLPAMHIFKIRGGKVYEIEAMGFMMPFRSKNGWSDFLR